MNDEQKPVALMRACERLPEAMQDIALDLIARLRVVADAHAATMAEHKAQADLLRAEVATAATKNAELAAMLAASAERTQALKEEVESLRGLNEALIAERDAHEAVEAAIARYVDHKREVDALLQRTGAQTHRSAMSRTEGREATDANEAADVDPPPPRRAAPPDPASADAPSAAEDAAHERDIGAAGASEGKKANGRRVSGSPPIPS
jgi:chromosome segregation ATPase